jgi:hypothetical protein
MKTLLIVLLVALVVSTGCSKKVYCGCPGTKGMTGF